LNSRISRSATIAGEFGDIEPRQRSHAVLAAGVAERLVVREFDEGPFFAGFAEEGGVAQRIEPVGDNIAFGVDHADHAVVIFESSVGRHRSEEEGGKIAHVLDLEWKRIEQRLEPPERDIHRFQGLGDPFEDFLAGRRGERVRDAAGHSPGGMDALATH